MKSCGIYIITNLKDRKVYIGSAVDIQGRFRAHKSLLRRNRHTNKHFQNAWNKDGEDFFIFEILEEVSRERLIEREVYYVDLYDSRNTDRGYNFLFPDRRKGEFHHTEETKRKIGEASKYQVRSPVSSETKEKIAKIRRGKTYEEIFGSERASFLKERARVRGLANASRQRERLQGKSYEEIYGEEKAKRVREKLHQAVDRPQSEQKREKCRVAKLKELNPMYRVISRDLRESIILQYQAGTSRKQIAITTGLTAYLIRKVLQEEGCL